MRPTSGVDDTVFFFFFFLGLQVERSVVGHEFEDNHAYKKKKKRLRQVDFVMIFFLNYREMLEYGLTKQVQPLEVVEQHPV